MSNADAASGLSAGYTTKHPISPHPAWLPAYDAVPPLAPIHTQDDRLSKITVCLRPFRAQGPRVEAERLGGKLLVHNYGHGGSGWSLSWGSAENAAELAVAGIASSLTGRAVAVIGAGALGLTLATLLQRLGAQVTIYAKDRPADTRSFRATGSWTPDSRIALTQAMAPGFPGAWEAMARASWRTYQSFLALPGTPVEFTDRYILSEETPEQAHHDYLAADTIGFARLNDRLRNIAPHCIDLPPGTHPFPTRYARRNSQLMFNITTLVQTLTQDFLIAGGRIEAREFHSPAELQSLPQAVMFNCTGYGSRALFGDRSLTPVRGQIGWLAPQSEVNYGLVDGDLNILSRRDGIVVQLSEYGESSGWNDANEEPDRREADEGLRRLRSIMAGMRSHGNVLHP